MEAHQSLRLYDHKCSEHYGQSLPPICSFGCSRFACIASTIFT
jgi:hypothetical protein